MTSSVDGADEAGGEVYSSDGLPPLVSPRIPRILLEADGKCNHDDLLDSGNFVDVDTATALFTTKPREGTKEKFARLQMEISQLKNEVRNEDLSKLAADLSSRLGTGVKAGDDLTQLLDEYSKRNTKKKPEQTGMVYELYGGTVISSSNIEERLLKLEEVIGSPSNKPLMARLEELENKMKRVDDKALEDAATRAKLIRSDLEAASKARSKLSTSSSSNDNKAITELHSQLIQLEGISSHLPALTDRLQQLAHLHVNGVNFCSRLTEAETSLSTIQGTLASVEKAVEKIEQGTIQDIKTMDSNLQKLEERMAKDKTNSISSDV